MKVPHEQIAQLVQSVQRPAAPEQEDVHVEDQIIPLFGEILQASETMTNIIRSDGAMDEDY